MKNHPFTTTLNRIEKDLKKAEERAYFTSKLFEFGKTEEAYNESLRLATDLEKLVLIARALPAYTGNRYAKEDVQHIMEETIPVEIGYTEQGWFSLRMPALLPHKERGGTEYIRQFLYPAMKRFFANKDQQHLDEAVLIIRHVYHIDRPERQMRDHDNMEVNIVSDIVGVYVLRDDAPKHCNHYYCSAKSTTERTEVYVVPRSEFSAWIEAEKIMPDEGVELYENV